MFSLTKIYTFLAAVAFSIISLVTFGYMKKKEGKEAEKVEQLLRDQNRREAGKKSAFKEKRDVDGISDSDLIDRLRRRGDDWGGL